MIKVTLNPIQKINNVAFGTVLIPYTLADVHGNLVDIDVEYSVNGGLTWVACPADLANPYHEVPVGLATSYAGTTHNFAWMTYGNAAPADDVQADKVLVRVYTTMLWLGGNTAVSDEFQVDNIHTVVVVSDLTTEQSGEVSVDYTLYNNSSTTSNIECYYSDDGGIEWKDCRIDADALLNPSGNLVTAPTGEAHTIKWTSDADVNVSEVMFKIVPYNELPFREIGYADETAPFYVNNYTEWFYKKVPYSFFALDTDDVMRYYLKILDMERQIQTDITTSLIKLLDPIKCPERYVDIFADALGVTVDAGAPVDIKRRQIASAVLIYKQKGKKSAFQDFFLTLGYKVDVKELSTDGTDCEEEFLGGKWYKTARINIIFLKYSDRAWIEPWEVDKLLSAIEDVRPIHVLIASYKWGFDFTDFLDVRDDDDFYNIVGSFSMLGGGWLNPPVEAVVFDTWFGDGVTTIFNETIDTTVYNVLPGSVIISATGVGNEPMIGVDDGVGVITGDHVTVGSINYATGVVSIEFDIAPDATAEVLIKFSYVQPYHRYRANVPHHIYRRDGNSLLVRSRKATSMKYVVEAAPSANYDIDFAREPTRNNIKVVVYNRNNDEEILRAVENEKGRLVNVFNKGDSIFWNNETLGATINGVAVYNVPIPVPSTVLPIVPTTAVITIDQMVIMGDADGNLYSDGGFIGSNMYLLDPANPGDIDYSSGDITIRLDVPIAPADAGIPINISYQMYEFVIAGDGITLDVPMTLNCLPIVPGTIVFTDGVNVLAYDDGLNGWEGPNVTGGAIDYATGVGNVVFSVAVAAPLYYGVFYKFTPIHVDENESRLFSKGRYVIDNCDGVTDNFTSPALPLGGSISNHLLTPTPIVPESLRMKCGDRYGRIILGVVGGVGFTGDVNFDTGAYDIVVTPTPDIDEVIVMEWETRRLRLIFDVVLDSQSDFDIQIETDRYYPHVNYDQCNGYEYKRFGLNRASADSDFVGRSGYAEGIGVGDGANDTFVGTLTKFTGAAIEPNSVTVLVWCDNLGKFPKSDNVPTQICAHDDGAGVIVSLDDDIPIWGTIDYATGAVEVYFGDAAWVPKEGANVVVHYHDDTNADSALHQLSWYNWKKKGSRLSILRNAALYYNA